MNTSHVEYQDHVLQLLGYDLGIIDELKKEVRAIYDDDHFSKGSVIYKPDFLMHACKYALVDEFYVNDK